MSTDVEQIKERLNIVDVISGYIKVEKAGINFKAISNFFWSSFIADQTEFLLFRLRREGRYFFFRRKI